MMTMWLPLILLLILLASAVALVVTVVRSCTLPRRVSKGACCGGCGYAFTGWSICPECGVAVAVGGVETPRLVLRHRGSIANAGSALFVLVLFGGLITAGISVAVFEHLGYRHLKQQLTLRPVTFDGTKTNYFIHVISDAEFGQKGSARFGEVILAVEIAAAGTLSPVHRDAQMAINNGCRHIRLSLTNDECRLVKPDVGTVTVTRGLAGPAIRDFLVDCGVQVSDSHHEEAGLTLAKVVKGERSISTQVVQPLSGNRSPVFATHSQFTMQNPAMPIRFFGLSSLTSWMLLVGATTVAIYVITLRLLIKRRHRVLSAGIMNRSGTTTPLAPAAPAARS